MGALKGPAGILRSGLLSNRPAIVHSVIRVILFQEVIDMNHVCQLALVGAVLLPLVGGGPAAESSNGSRQNRAPQQLMAKRRDVLREVVTALSVVMHEKNGDRDVFSTYQELLAARDQLLQSELALAATDKDRLQLLSVFRDDSRKTEARLKKRLDSSDILLLKAKAEVIKAEIAVLEATKRSSSDEAKDTIDAESRLQKLSLELPKPAKSTAIFKRIVIVGNMAYLSGHIPIDENGQIMKGKVGSDVDVPRGAAAARRCAIGLLATLRNEIGSLNKVRRLVKTTGMVNCTSDFTQHPEVVNGCSQLLVDIFGDRNGKGARAAVGMSSLPRGSICEIEMIFELKN